MSRIVAVPALVLIVSALGFAADPPMLPTPQKEHQWLQQLEGTWTTDTEALMEPGKPPMKLTGTESTRSLGGFWAMSEFKGDMMGVPVIGIMTLGYDAKKGKYFGTWVSSMDTTMYQYEGAVAGNTLTLNTEGPDPASGKVVKMRDVIEVKSKDHKVLTSHMQGDDGKWTKFMTINSKRK
jgi:hypothetical protein